jgi:hypothetical protein
VSTINSPSRAPQGDTGLDRLEELELLANPGINGAGFVHLAGLGRLKNLRVEGTPIVDAGLANLAGLRSLESLQLNSTAITDAGLAHLVQLENLRASNRTLQRVRSHRS